MGRLSSSPKSSFSHLFLSHPVGREGGNSFAVAVLLDVFFPAISPTGLFLQRKGGTNELASHFGRGEMDSASGHHQIFSRDGRNFVASAPSSIRGQFRFLLKVVYLQSVYPTICLLVRASREFATARYIGHAVGAVPLPLRHLTRLIHAAATDCTDGGTWATRTRFSSKVWNRRPSHSMRGVPGTMHVWLAARFPTENVGVTQ